LSLASVRRAQSSWQGQVAAFTQENRAIDKSGTETKSLLMTELHSGNRGSPMTAIPF
jgi:hypothetical protein